MIKKIYKVRGMNCASCAKMLELDLEEVGFKASCSYPKQELEVNFANPNDEQKILNIAQASGYFLNARPNCE